MAARFGFLSAALPLLWSQVIVYMYPEDEGGNTETLREEGPLGKAVTGTALHP